MTAAANTTTASAAAIRPQGRCGETTLAAGRLRPPDAARPPEAEDPPLPAEPPFPADLPVPVAGLRSLAKASPRCWGDGARARGGDAPVDRCRSRARASLGGLPVRSLGAWGSWGKAGGRGRGGRSVRSCGDT